MKMGPFVLRRAPPLRLAHCLNCSYGCPIDGIGPVYDIAAHCTLWRREAPVPGCRYWSRRLAPGYIVVPHGPPGPTLSMRLEEALAWRRLQIRTIGRYLRWRFGGA